MALADVHGLAELLSGIAPSLSPATDLANQPVSQPSMFVSPYIFPINQQAEVFIGYAGPSKRQSPMTEPATVPRSILSSSNPLFADYQPHNSNVFTTLGVPKYLTKLLCYRMAFYRWSGLPQPVRH